MPSSNTAEIVEQIGSRQTIARNRFGALSEAEQIIWVAIV